MLTKEYLKDNFIDAYFINEERDTIEILTTSEDKKEVFPTIIPFNEEHEGFKALLSKMSVDDLHERTYIKKKEERKLFEEQLIRIGKKDGFISEDGKIDKDFFPTLVKAIVDNPRLVIVIDDFILPGIIGFQILMMIYQSKTLNMDSQDIMITRPLTEDEI